MTRSSNFDRLGSWAVAVVVSCVVSYAKADEVSFDGVPCRASTQGSSVSVRCAGPRLDGTLVESGGTCWVIAERELMDAAGAERVSLCRPRDMELADELPLAVELIVVSNRSRILWAYVHDASDANSITSIIVESPHPWRSSPLMIVESSTRDEEEEEVGVWASTLVFAGVGDTMRPVFYADTRHDRRLERVDIERPAGRSMRILASRYVHPSMVRGTEPSTLTCRWNESERTFERDPTVSQGEGQCLASFSPQRVGVIRSIARGTAPAETARPSEVLARARLLAAHALHHTGQGAFADARGELERARELAPDDLIVSASAERIRCRARVLEERALRRAPHLPMCRRECALAGLPGPARWARAFLRAEEECAQSTERRRDGDADVDTAGAAHAPAPSCRDEAITACADVCAEDELAAAEPFPELDRVCGALPRRAPRPL